MSPSRWLPGVFLHLALSTLIPAQEADQVEFQADLYPDVWYIPGGEVKMGESLVPVRGFYLQKAPLTMRQFGAFCVATGREGPEEEAALPARDLSIREVLDYARWAGLALPGSLQWRRASELVEIGAFPWEVPEGTSGNRAIRLLVPGPADLFEARFRRLEDLRVGSEDERLSAFEKRLVAIEGRLTDQEGKLGPVSEALAGQRARLDALETSDGDRSKVIEDQGRRLKSLETGGEVRGGTLVNLEERLSGVEKTVDEDRKTTTDQEGRLGALETSNEEWGREIGRFREAMDTSEKANAEEMAGLSKLIHKLDTFCEGIPMVYARKANLESAGSRVAKLEERSDSLESGQRTLEACIDEDREKAEAIVGRVDTLCSLQEEGLERAEANSDGLASKVDTERFEESVTRIQGKMEAETARLDGTDGVLETRLDGFEEDAVKRQKLIHHLGRLMAYLFAEDPSKEPPLPMGADAQPIVPVPDEPDEPEGPPFGGEDALSARLLSRTGRALLEAKEWKAAEMVLKEAIALDPEGGSEADRVLLETAQEAVPTRSSKMVFVGNVTRDGRREGVQAKIGAWDGWYSEGPFRTVQVAPFMIDRHEVTNEEFKGWCDAQGHPYPPHWEGGRIPVGQEAHPVTGITCGEAELYAAHHGKRLPTAIQWETAARGTDGRTYPWGDDSPWFGGKPLASFTSNDPGRSVMKGTAIVGSYPGGGSSFGVLDMAGNAAEWTRTRDWGHGGGTPSMIVKGGSFQDGIFSLRSASKRSVPSGERDLRIGFRCVINLGENN